MESLAKKFDATAFVMDPAVETSPGGTVTTPAVYGNSDTKLVDTDGNALNSKLSNTLVTDGDKHYVVKDKKVYEATLTKGTDPNTIEVDVGTTEVTDKDVLSKVTPLAAIDKAIQDVDNLRSDLGAVQNRFESTIANLNNTVTNLSASRSRIEDADYAVEVSNMTRAQILQQAGTSVLAQANQVPQTVLSLLR